MNVTRASNTGQPMSAQMNISIFLFVVWLVCGGFIWLEMWLDGVVFFFVLMMVSFVAEVYKNCKM